MCSFYVSLDIVFIHIQLMKTDNVFLTSSSHCSHVSPLTSANPFTIKSFSLTGSPYYLGRTFYWSDVLALYSFFITFFVSLFSSLDYPHPHLACLPFLLFLSRCPWCRLLQSSKEASPSLNLSCRPISFHCVRRLRSCCLIRSDISAVSTRIWPRGVTSVFRWRPCLAQCWLWTRI